MSVAVVATIANANKITEKQMITVTDAAKEKLKELMLEHNDKYLRVVFQGFG